MPVEQLIVGWNRGGLGYVYELLKKSNIDVGLTFGPGTTYDSFREQLSSAHSIELSPYIVPFLGSTELASRRVIFLYRDPMRVLNSLYHLGLFHNEKDSPVQRTAFTHLPEFEASYRGRPAQAACSYICRWKSAAHQNRPGLEHIRVEEGPRAILTKLFGSCSGMPTFVTPDVHSSNCLQTILPSALPDTVRQDMLDLLLELGYREDHWFPRGGHAHYVNPDWHC